MPEIDTLNRVSKMCDKKSTLVIDELRAMLERLNSTQCLDVDSVQSRAFKDLEAMKQRIIDHVSSFFNNLYEDFSAKLNGSVKKVDFCNFWDIFYCLFFVFGVLRILFLEVVFG